MENKGSRMKTFINQVFILSLVLASAIFMGTQAYAEISDEDFTAAIEKYLETEDGQAKLGSTIQNYFQKQQNQARKKQEQAQAKAMEEQFKNPVKVDVGSSPYKGPKDAKVTVIEFSDFECPFCSRGDKTVKQILENYPNDVKVVFKNLPLPFHKNAEPAARAALAAGKQGKFWEMHDKFFANQKGLNEELYMSTAKELGLDMEQFKKDYESEELKKQVADDAAQARKIGIQGTPGFSVNGVLVKGAYPYEHFKKIIDRWLEEEPKG